MAKQATSTKMKTKMKTKAKAKAKAKASAAAKKASGSKAKKGGGAETPSLGVIIEKAADALAIGAKERVSECVQYAAFISIANGVTEEAFANIASMIYADIKKTVEGALCPECGEALQLCSSAGLGTSASELN